MNINGQSLYNVQNAINNQNTFYQRNVNNINRNYSFSAITSLYAQTLSSVENINRANKFEIIGPWGATPGPYGLAGSPTVDTISKPPNIER